MDDKFLHKFYYWGPYVTKFKLDPAFCARILEAGKHERESYNQRLAGKIQKQMKFDMKKNSWAIAELSQYVNAWYHGYYRWADLQKNKNTPTSIKNLIFDSMWINYQGPHEHNPAHVHVNADVSFVIWLSFPNAIKEEWKTDESNSCRCGCLSIYYGDARPFATAEHCIAPEENSIIMFPGWVRHAVMPFKSQCERISLAANVMFEW